MSATHITPGQQRAKVEVLFSVQRKGGRMLACVLRGLAIREGDGWTPIAYSVIRRDTGETLKLSTKALRKQATDAFCTAVAQLPSDDLPLVLTQPTYTATLHLPATSHDDPE